MIQVYCSDIVFVDARDRRGIGVGAEMMWAKLNSKPLLTWAPKDTHYNKNQATVLGVPVANYVHPFVECLSDKVVETLEEGAKWIKEALQDTYKVKGFSDIHDAMNYYKSAQLDDDIPMQELLKINPILRERIADVDLIPF